MEGQQYQSSTMEGRRYQSSTMDELYQTKSKIKEMEHKISFLKKRKYSLEKKLYWEEESTKIQEIGELKSILESYPKYESRPMHWECPATVFRFSCYLMKTHPDLRRSKLKKTVQELIYHVGLAGHIKFSEQEKQVLKKYYVEVEHIRVGSVKGH